MRKSTSKKADIEINRADPGDIEAVSLIEAATSPNPWRRDYFEAELVNELSGFYVSREKDSGEVIGFMVFWEIDQVIELHKIAVKEDFRQRGIASALMDFLLLEADRRGIKEIYLEVRESNVQAIGLYWKYGFVSEGKRKNYYPNPCEDALVFKKIL